MKLHADYQQQKKLNLTLKIREELKELPVYVGQYARGIEPLTSASTRLSYIRDIHIFLFFLITAKPELSGLSPKDIPLSTLESLTVFDIEECQEYLKLYRSPTGEWHQNGERGISRKIAALRSFFHYLYQHDMITANPLLKISTPKIHEKEIIRLDEREINLLVNHLEEKKLRYEVNRKRDTALILLLLGTGIRVSECVGLDLQDVDFSDCRIRVIRKGGNEMFVYFGEEVAEALKNYLEERCTITPADPDEKALFLSRKRKRISIKSVETLVKNYSRDVIAHKKITPHKLRSTYGTRLYEETGDIYLVADSLGHKDINTSAKHYVTIQDKRRRQAAEIFRIRKEETL